MKLASIIALAVVLPAVSGALRSEEIPLFRDGAGPVFLSVQIWHSGKQVRLEAKARNATGSAIREAKFCVGPVNEKKNCTFSLGMTGVWEPGETVQWSLSGKEWVGIELPVVTVMVLELDSRLRAVATIYVEPIDGEDGPLIRNQLIATLLNSRRFRVTASQWDADAFMKSGRKVSETIATERVALEVASAAGDVLWVWDDSKPCPIAKAKCIVNDLVRAGQ